MKPLVKMFWCLSLSTGVKVVLALLFMSNIFYVATTVINVILQVGTFDFTTAVGLRIFNAGFCVLSLPFIASGFYGIAHRNDNYLRGCFYMLALGFVLDLFFTIGFLAFEENCKSMPFVLVRHGHAFACGAIRLTSILFVSLLTILEAYILLGIWSLCEEFKGDASENNFKQLISKTMHATDNHPDNPYLHTRHLRRGDAPYGATDQKEKTANMGWSAFREAAPTPQLSFEEAFGPKAKMITKPDGTCWAETPGCVGQNVVSLPVPPHVRKAFEDGELHPSVMNLLTSAPPPAGSRGSSNIRRFKQPDPNQFADPFDTPFAAANRGHSSSPDSFHIGTPVASYREEALLPAYRMQQGVVEPPQTDSMQHAYASENWVEKPITGPPLVREGLSEIVPGEVRYSGASDGIRGSSGVRPSSTASRAISSDLLGVSAAAWSSPSFPQSSPEFGGHVRTGMPPSIRSTMGAELPLPGSSIVVLDPVRLGDVDRSDFAYRGLQPLKSKGIGAIFSTSANLGSAQSLSPRGSSMPSGPGTLAGEFQPTNLSKAPPGPQYQPPLQRNI